MRQVPVTKREANKKSPDRRGKKTEFNERKGLGGKQQVREDEIRRMSVGAQMLVNPQSARAKPRWLPEARNQVLVPGVRAERDWGGRSDEEDTVK